MDEAHIQSLERLAGTLRQRGLATPALMLVDLLAPLSFLGEQFALLAGPLLPTDAKTFIASLGDERSRELLQKKLVE